MVVRFLLVVAFALVMGSMGPSVSPDAVVIVEHDRDAAGDADEAHLVLGEAVHVTDAHATPAAGPGSQAPVPPFRHGVFRPPRAAFD